MDIKFIGKFEQISRYEQCHLCAYKSILLLNLGLSRVWNFVYVHMMIYFEQIVLETNIPRIQNTKHINIKQLL